MQIANVFIVIVIVHKNTLKNWITLKVFFSSNNRFVECVQKYCMRRRRETIKQFVQTSTTSLEEIRYVEC